MDAQYKRTAIAVAAVGVPTPDACSLGEMRSGIHAAALRSKGGI
jgi:hypothetical protein